MDRLGKYGFSVERRNGELRGLRECIEVEGTWNWVFLLLKEGRWFEKGFGVSNDGFGIFASKNYVGRGMVNVVYKI